MAQAAEAADAKIQKDRADAALKVTQAAAIAHDHSGPAADVALAGKHAAAMKDLATAGQTAASLIPNLELGQDAAPTPVAQVKAPTVE
jgi:hypothetical protein